VGVVNGYCDPAVYDKNGIMRTGQWATATATINAASSTAALQQQSVTGFLQAEMASRLVRNKHTDRL